ISHTHTLIHSKRNHSFRKTLSISIVTSILLSNQMLLANPNLPSGGKFTNGSSGSISISNGANCKNCVMNIKGDNKNNVIAWGGGFNIGKGYEVHFEKGKNGGNNYLNLDYSKNPSTIAGLLQGNNNNVFIVNPSGVIVTESGSINANKFGISTSPIDTDTLNAFKEANKANNGVGVLVPFSPVFKANSTRGDIINKGSIQANEVVMVGNRVILQAGVNLQEDGKIGVNKINANNINIEGNTINIDVATLENNPTLNLKANKDGNLYLSATGYYYNTNAWNNTYSSFTNIKDTHNQYISIGSDVDWWHFAKGWNENKDGNFKNATDFKLTSDIDFQGNKGIGVVGKDWQNYADYCINGLGCTSMIVGDDYDNAFTANFDGQGYTLKNINIDTTITVGYKPENVGIFGYIRKYNDNENSTIKNINVDYMGGGIKADNARFVGSFAGYIDSGMFSNIVLQDIGEMLVETTSENFQRIYAGGFAGYITNGKFDKISLNKIKSILVDNRQGTSFVGGFTGRVVNKKRDTKLTNITIRDIDSIIAKSDYDGNGGDSNAGGFVGYMDGAEQIKNIEISNIGEIKAETEAKESLAGGFAGRIVNSGSNVFSNIVINDIGSISSLGKSKSFAGGFVGLLDSATFLNITLNNIGNILSSGNGPYQDSDAGGFVGYIWYANKGTFSNIYINFKDNATIMAISELYPDYAYVGKFFGNDNGNISSDKLSNIHIYYNGSKEALDNPNSIANATNDKEKPFYNNGITLHPYTDKQEDFINDVLNDEALKQAGIYKDENGNLSFFKPFDNSGDNGNNEDSNFIDKNKDGLNDVELSSDDFSNKLVNNIIQDLLDEKLILSLDANKLFIIANGKATLNTNYLKGLLSKYKEDTKLSQSLNFLLAFYGEEVDNNGLGLGNELANKDKNGVWNTTKQRVEKIKHSKQELENFIKGNNNPNYTAGGLLGLMSFFAEWKDKYELYTSGLATEEQMKNLESWFKNNGANLKAYQALLKDKVLKEFAYDDIANIDVKGSLTFIGGEWIANLKEPEYKDNGGSDQTINSPLKDINASMLDKQQVVLIKPAEEEKETLDEEKGVLNQRTCVVSENFKTNNPCMAQRI
ncbi:hypothetical protein B6S12_06140, partial [Helicobacter valdiviensis]